VSKKKNFYSHHKLVKNLKKLNLEIRKKTGGNERRETCPKLETENSGEGLQ
jgi:hypothetical protein